MHLVSVVPTIHSPPLHRVRKHAPAERDGLAMVLPLILCAVLVLHRVCPIASHRRLP